MLTRGGAAAKNEKTTHTTKFEREERGKREEIESVCGNHNRRNDHTFFGEVGKHTHKGQ